LIGWVGSVVGDADEGFSLSLRPASRRIRAIAEAGGKEILFYWLLEPIERLILILGEFHLCISRKRDSFRKHREGQFSKKRFHDSKQPISEPGKTLP
jgi:hypothetical protein